MRTIPTQHRNALANAVFYYDYFHVHVVVCSRYFFHRSYLRKPMLGDKQINANVIVRKCPLCESSASDSISNANRINTYAWKMKQSIHSEHIHSVRIIEYALILFRM